MSKYVVSNYKSNCQRGTGKEKVFVYLVESPNEILDKYENPILAALRIENLSSAVGLYIYRYKYLTGTESFSKIGEVSRIEGIEKRFERGWHGTESYGDTYLNKLLYEDVKAISTDNPMYFIFYEFVAENSFPKIDENFVFEEHKRHFGKGTTNNESFNGNLLLGKNLVWHNTIFNEVYNLNFPNGKAYPL